MASFHSRKWKRDLSLAASLLLAAAAFFAAPGTSCRSAHAGTTFPSDYCYQTDIAITYGGSGTVTNQPVRVVINADGMIGTGQLNANAWDIKPIQGSMTNEVNLTAQELGGTASPWWIFVPSISAGETRTHRLYTGSPEQRRDQGIWFTGADYMQVADNAALDITDNLRIDIAVENLSGTNRSNAWLNHFTGTNVGYRIRTPGDLPYRLIFDIDAGTCSLTWNSSWTGERQVFSFQYIAAAGNDAFIYRNGVLAQSCDTDQGPIGASANDLFVGVTSALTSFLSGVIVSDVQIWNGSTLVAHYGFDANAMTETVSTNPFSGTVDDYSANGLTGTYTFNRPQTDWTYSIGPTQLVSGSDQVTLPDVNPDVLGPAFGVDPSVVKPEVQTGIFYKVFLNEWVDSSPVRSFGFVTVLALVGLFLAIAVYRVTKYVPLALFVMAIPLAVGVGNGWVPFWWMVLWVVMALGGWFAQRQTESP